MIKYVVSVTITTLVVFNIKQLYVLIELGQTHCDMSAHMLVSVAHVSNKTYLCIYIIFIYLFIIYNIQFYVYTYLAAITPEFPSRD